MERAPRFLRRPNAHARWSGSGDGTGERVGCCHCLKRVKGSCGSSTYSSCTHFYICCSFILCLNLSPSVSCRVHPGAYLKSCKRNPTRISCFAASQRRYHLVNHISVSYSRSRCCENQQTSDHRVSTLRTSAPSQHP